LNEGHGSSLMSFLDRFKPQPRWRHSDATIRAAAIAEIPDDEESLATIRELAAGDDDVRVRRAAAARLERAADILRWHAPSAMRNCAARCSNGS
jgi:hypothetical protein